MCACMLFLSYEEFLMAFPDVILCNTIRVNVFFFFYILLLMLYCFIMDTAGAWPTLQYLSCLLQCVQLYTQYKQHTDNDYLVTLCLDMC